MIKVGVVNELDLAVGMNIEMLREPDVVVIVAEKLCWKADSVSFPQSLSMVSIRRRRYLGLCTGKSSIPVELPKPAAIGNTVENSNQNVKPFSVHPMPSDNLSLQMPVNVSEALPGSSNASGSSSSKEEVNHYYPGKQIKRRKRHRRKHFEDQEPCVMRGVYFKNMKWQAAIKVDKKQIHLGTVGSQEEAARLYDRAAFMCGREPNFELLEEEKQELRQYKWEDFLAVTRNAINNKKHQKRLGADRRKKPESQLQSNDGEREKGTHASSASDDGDADTSVS
ncbi:ethylene-responsive transcription factor-like protein At4g13040 isoform X1 [Phoenix dactylifera]|uniref:Ethylene-responsive transcription factor-like protein At4g13040 isoform X1 n=2 Tax=Phoenix dactylifera TaxID=42345 RepID=A0A8B7CPP5_PHODC|nr:ethylene-responsive transcription factor-like protein At4g13040 isoform X1 [Phoenix dactylifera]